MAAKLQGKVAIVTGGSSGIGTAIVALFLEHEAKVISLDVAEPPPSTSDSLLSLKCNVASESEVQAAVTKILEKWGQIDVLVNCAGVMDGFERVGQVSNAVWERCLNINLTGPMQLMRVCIPELLKTKGAIINICSIAAVSGGSAGVAYTASKHGLLGISRQTAFTYGKEGIRCNAVLPGAVETNIMQNAGVAQDEDGLKALGPFHATVPGVVKPAHVANAVLFLATSPSVNGAELAVDCGWRSM